MTPAQSAIVSELVPRRESFESIADLVPTEEKCARAIQNALDALGDLGVVAALYWAKRDSDGMHRLRTHLRMVVEQAEDVQAAAADFDEALTRGL